MTRTERIVAAYAAGESSAAIGKRERVSAPYVRSLVREAGGVIRAGGSPPRRRSSDLTGRTAAIVEAYQGGATPSEIAQRMGLTPDSVTTALAHSGIEMRGAVDPALAAAAGCRRLLIAHLRTGWHWLESSEHARRMLEGAA